jgi:hypothetical protein
MMKMLGSPNNIRRASYSTVSAVALTAKLLGMLSALTTYRPILRSPRQVTVQDLLFDGQVEAPTSVSRGSHPRGRAVRTSWLGHQCLTHPRRGGIL